MAEKIDHNPRAAGQDQAVQADVDRQAIPVPTGGTGPEVIRRFGAWGVNRLANAFELFETEAAGTWTDGAGLVHRVGNLVATIKGLNFSSLIASVVDGSEDVVTSVESAVAKLGILNDLANKLRATISTEVRALSPNLLAILDQSEDSMSWLESLDAFLKACNSGVQTLRILANAYDSMVFGTRNLQVNAPQDHINGPARLVSTTNVAAGTYDYDFFAAPYALITIQALWANQAGKTGQLDFLARLDDNVAGTWTNVNGLFTVSGAALGVAAQNGQGLYVCSRAERIREFRVEYVKVGAANAADTVEIWMIVGSNC